MRDLFWFGPEPEEKTLIQANNCMDTGPVHGVALMADNHLGYGVPIGAVVAYKGAVSPSGVGFDIGCGVKAVRTNLRSGDLVDGLGAVLDEINNNIEFGMGRRNEVAIDHPVMDSPYWDIVPREIADLKKMASEQLGTVGAGNHYVDILLETSLDSQGRSPSYEINMPVWVACHFGSRGFGHKTATYFLKRGGAKDDMMSAPYVLRDDEHDYYTYLDSMKLAGEYAYAGRDQVNDEVLRILGAKSIKEIHNHHNFAWAETHLGEDLMIVRKGATPAFNGQEGFVGGSMGDIAVVVEGNESKDSDSAYRSTVHGAGRIHSRIWAKGKYKKGVEKVKGNITRQMMSDATKEFGVIVRGGDVDESPFVYRKLGAVLAAQGDTIKINHTLKPIGVVMAGANTRDDYKD